MTEEFKKQIATVFDDVATQYDSNLFFEISAQKLVNLIDHDNIKRILDVATGTGKIAHLAAQKFSHSGIEALDISLGMLDKAKKKASEKGLKNIKFRFQDIESIENTNNKFDIITCGYALFFLPNIENTLQKLYNCLNSGGKFIFSTFTDNAFSPFREMFFELLKEYGIERPKVSGHMLQTPQEIKELCQKNNISNIRIEFSEIRYMISLDDWWSLLNSAGYKGMLSQIGSSRIDEFKEKHFNQILSYSKSEKILLIADSLFSLVQK